ncbi:MAG: hypothetical protein WDN08_11305 [Rhizomicrobium sp.]
MKTFPAALALAAALILSACYPPTTSHPVGTTAGLKSDPALSGLWVGKDADGKPGYFHFLPQSDGSITAVIVEGGDKPDADWMIATLTTATLGDKHYMNARLTSTNGKTEEGAPSGTVPVLYRIDAKGTLTLAMMDETPTKAAIKAGKIKGTPGQGDMGDAEITADPTALDGFFKSAAAASLFDKPFFTLHRVK